MGENYERTLQGLKERLKKAVIRAVESVEKQVFSNKVGQEIDLPIGDIDASIALEQIQKLNTKAPTISSSRSTIQPPKKASEVVQHSNNPKQPDELIYLDDVADDGSVRRTYFRNIDQLSNLLQTTKPSGQQSYIKKRDPTSPKVRGRLNFDDPSVRGIPVFLSASHREIQEALDNQIQEEDGVAGSVRESSSRLLRIDFDDLVVTNVKQKVDVVELTSTGAKTMCSRGVQTDQASDALCSRCHASVGMGNTVYMPMSFGTSPRASGQKSSIKKLFQSKDGAQLGFSGQRRPASKERPTPGSGSGGIKVYDPFLAKRLELRNKGASGTKISEKYASDVQLSRLSGGGRSQFRPSPGKLNQKSYLASFESKLNYYENSDIKYFSVERRLARERSQSKGHMKSRSKSIERSLDNEINRSYLARATGDIRELRHDRSLHELRSQKSAHKSSLFDDTTSRPKIKMKSRDNSVHQRSLNDAMELSASSGSQTTNVPRLFLKDDRQGLHRNPARLPLTLNIDLQDISCMDASLVLKPVEDEYKEGHYGADRASRRLVY